METIDKQIENLEKKLRYNQRIIHIGGLVIIICIIIIGWTWGNLTPIPMGSNLEIGRPNKKSVLNEDGLTFFGPNDMPITKLNVADEYAPYLHMQNENTEVKFGVFKDGGGELLIRRYGVEPEDWQKKAHLIVSPDNDQVSFLFSSSQIGEIHLGINEIGEPELVMKRNSGGKIEMRITNKGEPLLYMQDAGGKVILDTTGTR